MNERVEKLLKPVSESQPCGRDLSNDPRFDALETLLKGKPEVELGTVKKPAEPPNWGDLQEQSVSFLEESKNLRVAVMLGCSWLKTGGLAGFRDGLELIQGLLEKYWATVYPLLDPEDANDPTQRVNILRALTEPRGGVTGWLTISEYLYSAPLCTPKGAAPVSYDQLVSVLGLSAASGETGGASGPGVGSLENAIRSVEAAQLVATTEVLTQALAATTKIDEFLTTTLGASSTISFEVLTTTLKGMTAALKPYLPRDPSAEGEGESAAAEVGGAGSLMISGAVRSRQDVVRALDAVCSYYEQVEPSSPVPFLLRRAQKLAVMNFIEAVQELNIATVDTLKPSMGSALPESTPPPSS